jgi:transcriptional regulator with XRE-family HTH domain
MPFNALATSPNMRHDMARDERTRAIGERIKECRERLHLTQEELARMTSAATITGNVISRWERGRNRPSQPNLEELAAALGVEQGYLMFGKDRPGSAAAALSSREIVTELQNIGAQLGELVGVLRGQAPGIETLVADALKTLGVDPAALPHNADGSPSLAPPAPPSRSSRKRVGGR